MSHLSQNNKNPALSKDENTLLDLMQQLKSSPDEAAKQFTSNAYLVGWGITVNVPSGNLIEPVVKLLESHGASVTRRSGSGVELDYCGTRVGVRVLDANLCDVSFK